MRPAFALSFLLLALATRPAQGDGVPRKGLAAGDVVPPFSAKDLEGREVTLASLRDVTDAEVAASIRSAAGWDAAKSWKREDAVETVPGIRGQDGTVSAARRLAFLRAAGRDLGLLATEERAARIKTLGDVEAWLRGAADAPIVLVFWSSRCPSAKAYADRIVAVSAETGARVYPVASNANEPRDGVRAAEAATGYRVLLDPEQAVCDALGGRRTPHAFLLDRHGVLRYSGAIDDDLPEELDASKRHSWLRDAALAIATGKAVAVPTTEPEGCPIKRKAP